MLKQSRPSPTKGQKLPTLRAVGSSKTRSGEASSNSCSRQRRVSKRGRATDREQTATDKSNGPSNDSHQFARNIPVEQERRIYGCNGSAMLDCGRGRRAEDGDEFTALSASPRSVNSADSFGTLASTGEESFSLELNDNANGSLAQEGEADAVGGNNGTAEAGSASRGLGIVGRTLFDSWKEFLWQVRLCPMAIEGQEVVRRTSALKMEMTGGSFSTSKGCSGLFCATSAAREEEQRISGWWKGEAEILWRIQSQRRQSHETLAARHEEELAAHEDKRTELLSKGCGRELAKLDSMDEANHLESLRQVETLFSFAVGGRGTVEETRETTTPKAGVTTGTAAEGLFTVAAPGAHATPLGTTLRTSARPPGVPDGREKEEGTPAGTKEQQRQEQQQQEEDEEARVVQETAEADCTENFSSHLQLELERVALHESVMKATADKFRRRRQSLAVILWCGLTAMYRDCRARARRTFVSECAADIGRIKQLASSPSSGGGSTGEGQNCPLSPPPPLPPPPPAGGTEDVLNEYCCISSDILCSCGESDNSINRPSGVDVTDSSPDVQDALRKTTATIERPGVAGQRERTRATRELRSEASRVARWDKLQREVLRRSTYEVTRLLTSDGLRRHDGGGWPYSWRQRGDRRGGDDGVAKSTLAVHKRARLSMRELRGRQADVSLEARSIERSWIVSLAKWEAQLVKARAAAADAEVRGLRILQREDAEVGGRGRGRVGRAFSTSPNMVPPSLQQQNQQTARALEVSQSLADVIDREQDLVDDAQSALVVDLAKIVADENAKRAEAAAVARRHWWAEAREILLDLFHSVHSSNRNDQERGGGCADVDVGIHGSGSATEKPAATSSASLQLIRTSLDELLRAEEILVEKAAKDFLTAVNADEYGGGGGGPLHVAAAENQRSTNEVLDRCTKAFEAASFDPSTSTVGQPTPVNLNQWSTEGGSSSGRLGGAHNPEEELASFRGRLETDAVQLAVASFDMEVRELAIDAAIPVAASEAVMPPCFPGAPSTMLEIEGKGSPPPFPLDGRPPSSDLTRSHLDLRRVARVKAFARTMEDMLSTARKAILKETQRGSVAATATENDYNLKVSSIIPRNSGKIGHLRTEAQAKGDKALETALNEAETLSEERSWRSKTAAAIRRRALGSVVSWVGAAADAELRRSERRQRRRQHHQHRIRASLEDFERIASEEQQDWLRQVRRRGHEATEVARATISDHVAELILHEPQREQDQEGGYEALPMAADTPRDLSSLQDRSSSAGEGTTCSTDDKDKPGEQGNMEQGEQSMALNHPALVMNTVAVAEGVNRDHVDDHHSGRKFPQPQFQGAKRQHVANQDDDGDVFVDPPSLEGLRVEAMAVLAAAEASCICDIDAWVEKTLRRELEMISAWMAETASGDVEERDMTETELETLESAFRAARTDTDEVVSSACCEAYSLRPSGVSGAGAAPSETEEPANPEPDATIGSTEFAAPGFFAEEEEECSALWSSLERSLSSLKLALKTIPAGSGGSRKDEKEGEEGIETKLAASRIITGLECELRAVVTDTFSSTGQVEEVQSIIRASSDELRVAFTLISEATQAKWKSPPATAAEGRVTDGERRNDFVPASTLEIAREDCGAPDGGIGTE
ncbi:unnamed protein product [Ectocarpus sp. CCAP 1310/34]|nr:unnamed protein product [Ectocarpus sp. CCAP 1310/34]